MAADAYSGSCGQPQALYVHIPFCLRKCPYCDFYSVVGTAELVQRYLRALKIELSRLADRDAVLPLRSLYLGGGTPTILPVGALAEILDLCADTFGFEPGAEITCEANPGTVTQHTLKELCRAGVTRLSLGVQSFRNDELRFLGRLHSAADARRAVTDAKDAGFRVLSLDLIYCLPGQTRNAWDATLAEVCQLQPDHVSAYCLEIEEKTPLGIQLQRGEITPLPEEVQATLYRLTADRLGEAGIMQYEISNYSRPGAECRHNLTYWHNEPYVGAGASAWSYVNGERRQNVTDVEVYITACLEGQLPIAYSERCYGAQAANETLMLGLRLTEGIDLKAFQARHGVDLAAEHAILIAQLEAEGLVKCGERLSLTAAGMAVATEIIAALALPEED